MARTKASVGSKVSSGKSSKARCSAAPVAASPGTSSSGKASSSSGGNPVCPRETPTWQKPITNFFVCTDKAERAGDDSGTDTDTSPNKNTTRNKENNKEESQKNTVLDDSIHLEPLNGEDCHKIEEFYPKNGVKGKGVGKKSKGKENLKQGKEKRNSLKRDLEIEEVSVSKKVKVN